MSQLQENISGIVAAFYTCAQNCSPLSREELRQLMEQEFGDAMENPQDPESIRKVLCFLGDENNCGVGLRELLSLVFHVAKACYKPLQQQQHQQVPERGVDNQDQDTESQEQDTHQIQEGETPEQESQQIQEGETAEQDQDTPQGDGTEAPEGDPEGGEILDAATPEQDRNTCEAAEAEEATKEEPKTHQAPEAEGPGEGSNHHEGPEPEPAKQDPNPPPETRGKDPQKTQVCEAPWKDPNPGQIQQLLPHSPQQDAKALGTLCGPDGHQIPESKGLEMEHSEAQQLQGQLVVEQQLLQPLYQWPPEQ
ncbi:cornulin-like [Myiozetetes cayanensis]|uniref:cornulin-like n=1 Tax=Myiozetetes cayanensis TaxID=478635 RepID=UPI00215F8B8A|nr:cornulin-like [Myiozetetes cayanensis]